MTIVDICQYHSGNFIGKQSRQPKHGTPTTTPTKTTTAFSNLYTFYTIYYNYYDKYDLSFHQKVIMTIFLVGNYKILRERIFFLAINYKSFANPHTKHAHTTESHTKTPHHQTRRDARCFSFLQPNHLHHYFKAAVSSKAAVFF